VRVAFFLEGERDLEALRRIDPDREYQGLQRGDRAWVLQTYLRLARAGHPVELVGQPPRDGLIVFHVKNRRALARRLERGSGVLLLGIRADNREAAICDFEVVQNGRFADGRRRFFVPSWPQPALKPRHPDRGTAIRRIAFKGFSRNLDPAFLQPRWSSFLACLDIAWDVHAGEYAGTRTDHVALGWDDYREVDLALAVRPHDRRLHTSKPASKLVNSWIAGVPALLGAEFAYRELRRSPLDYVEIANVEEAEAAVERLRSDPDLYRAMVENGRVRAREFTIDRLTERWRELLFETLPSLAESPRGRRLRHTPLLVKRAGRRLGRLLSLRPAR
jgi:hypothetical protein